MAIAPFSSLLFLFVFNFLAVHSTPLSLPHVSSSYFSPMIFSNYQKMLNDFKIFIYIPNRAFTFSSPAESAFYNSLINSPFVTHDGDEAHLFFLPFPSYTSPRSLARLVRDVRIELPYWNRTLGADHFYLSCAGMGYVSDRNIVELKKNSVQISCFPATDGKFIPHKDITFPPVVAFHAPHVPPVNDAEWVLGYVKNGWVKESTLVKELTEDGEFLTESEPSDQLTFYNRLNSGDFCLFEFGRGDISGIGEALRFGCVPVFVTDRPINDLPFMDVLRWQAIAVFVGNRRGVTAGELKRELRQVGKERLDGMRKLGATAARHFVWNESPQPLDAFNTMMYQLWLRRHTIRYVERNWAQS